MVERMVELTSVQNEVVKGVVALQDKKNRVAEGKIILEGEKSIQGAQDAGLTLESIFYVDEKYAPLAQKARVQYKVNEKILAKISSTKSPAPVVAVVKAPPAKVCGNKIVVLENIKDAGNLGTIIRSAVAFGLDGIILCGDCVDAYEPKTIRAAVGTIFKIPVMLADAATLNEFKKTHSFISTVVTGGKPLESFTFPEKFLLFFGSEAQGLSSALQEKCTDKLTIKMTKNAESLNLSVSAGIVFHHLHSLMQV